MDTVLNVRESFPLLIPSNSFKRWRGIISYEGNEISVLISTPHFPAVKDMTIMCPLSIENEIHRKLDDFVETNGSKGFLPLLQYLKDSKNKEDNKDASRSDSSSSMKLEIYLLNNILNELKQLDSENIVTCSGDLKKITLRVIDVRGVEHQIVIDIPITYPKHRPTVTNVDLPEVALADLNKAGSILDIFSTFQTLVDSFQDFWTMYESLTKNTWLIDPEHPSHRDTHCRIVIGENVSMLVSLNPQDVNTCPDIKFLGPDSAILPFINSMEKKLKMEGWNEDWSLMDNLLSLLGLDEFPQAPEVSEQDLPQNDECSICFMGRLPDHTLPTKICNNSKCSAYFHITCLAQWFQAVPTNETSFNLISGDCPLCGERILCPIKVS